MISNNRRLSIIPAALIAPTILGLHAVHTPDALTGFAGGVLIGLTIVFGLGLKGRCAAKVWLNVRSGSGDFGPSYADHRP